MTTALRDEAGLLTRAGMEAALAEGGTVLWMGRQLRRVSELPSEAELAVAARLDSRITQEREERHQRDDPSPRRDAAEAEKLRKATVPELAAARSEHETLRATQAERNRQEAEALRRQHGSAKTVEPSQGGDGLDALGMPALREHARQHDIDLHGASTKADILAAIRGAK